VWDELVRAGLDLLRDNLPPLALALAVVGGVAAGVFLYHRSRSKKEVAIYAEALKDVTDALKTSNQTVESTQKRLTEVHATNISLNEQLVAAHGQLKAERETFAQRLRAQQAAFEATLQTERATFARALAEAEGRIRALVADVNGLERERSGSVATVRALTDKVAELETRLAALQEQLAASETARADATAELERLRTEVQALRARVAKEGAEGQDGRAEEEPARVAPVEAEPPGACETGEPPALAGERETKGELE
jgi:chromosome segregation ATPase